MFRTLSARGDLTKVGHLFRVPGAPQGRRRASAFLAFTLVSSAFVVIPALPAAASVPSQEITTAGPLTAIVLGNELSCQVLHEDDSAYEFFPAVEAPGDCGTLLVVDGTLFAPDFNSHGPEGGATATDALGTYTPFTPVSQSNIPSPTDPSVTTVVDAGETGIRVSQFDRYVVGQESYSTDIQLENSSSEDKVVRVFRGGDCFLGGSDAGFGYEDPATGTVGCREAVEGLPGNRLETWVPITDGSTYYEAFFSDVWSWIGGEGHPLFPSTCECDILQDNGAGISWEVTVPAGGSVVVSHLTSFSPAGTLPLSTSKTADNPSSAPATQNGYTITVSNPNDFMVTLDSIVDFLPGGFSYVEGSTTGVTSGDPSIGEGPTLTWSGSFGVPASGSINIHFNVTVAEAPGEYLNEASATAGSFAVASSGPTAPITVASDNQAPVAVDDSASTTQNNSVSIEVLANDSDPDEDQLSISNLSQPENGTAEIQQNGVPYVLYTPDEGFTGVDTFTYTANDGELDSNVATVTVTVTSENEPPVAVDDSASTGEGSGVNIDVLANDSDPDEDSLSVTNLTQPANGSTFVDEDGTVRYTPDEGFSGTDTFTYTANDGELDSNVATVTVNVGEAATCEVETSEGCTATTDNGVTNAGNPISVVMTVPAGQPAGVYFIREIDQTVPKPAGAFEWFAPEGATEIIIEVSCDESQCPRFRNRQLDLQLTVIKENPDGTVKTLLPCVQGRRGQIMNPPPCVLSVFRDIPGSGDLIWSVKVLGGDPKAGGAR